jgi:hypothetical protein
MLQPFYGLDTILQCLAIAPLWGIFYVKIFNFLPTKVKSFAIWNFSFYLSLLIFTLSIVL